MTIPLFHFGLPAAVESVEGTPRLVVDGVACPPMWYTSSGYTRPAYLQALGESGMRVFFVAHELEWQRPGAFAALRREVEMLLAQAPEALIVLRTCLHPPAGWLDAHPDAVVCYQDGTPVLPSWDNCGGDGRRMYSLASAQWREDGSAALAEFLAMLEQETFSRRVIGFFLCAGGTGEWYYPGMIQDGERCADYSPAFRQTYGALLRERYGTVEALRRAWGDETASFENPRIPGCAERAFCNMDDELLAAYQYSDSAPPAPATDACTGSFLNPAGHRYVVDYLRAWDYATADSIIHFARALKAMTGGTKIVGSFYGAFGCTNYHTTGTTSGVLRILDSGVVDFLAAPGVYENRQPGGATAQREMQDAFRLRNRMFVVEEDTRTFLMGRNADWGVSSLTDTVNVMKREFGRNLAEDLVAWWFDMPAGGGWYDHPELLALIRRQQEVARRALAGASQATAEIALIFDHESVHYTGQRTLTDLCHQLRSFEIHRIGAPVAYHFLEDLARPDLPDYKLYVFMNTFAVDAQGRESIRRRVRANGATALWLYAAGLIDPDRTPAYDVANMAELTGIRARLLPGSVFPAFRLCGAEDGPLAGVARDREYGFFDRDSFGDACCWQTQPPGPAWSSLLCPWITADDPDAEVYARFSEGNAPAIAQRRFAEWTSVCAYVKAVRAELLRAIARAAGCFIFHDGDDVLYAGKDFVTLHASTPGEKRLRFPAPADPFELYQRRAYGHGVREISVPMRKGETRTFHLGGEM